MKVTAHVLMALFLVSSASFASEAMTLKEKQIACKSIINALDYDEGSSVSLCVKGKWIVSDVESGSGNRQVAFSWDGKASKNQSKDDHCAGYVLTKTQASSKKTILVTDLDCK
jgi:hypothetical protein